METKWWAVRRRVFKVTQGGDNKQNKISSSESRIQFNEERQLELNDLISQNSTDIQKTKQTLGKEQNELNSNSQSLERINENISRQNQLLNEHEQKTNDLRQKTNHLEQELKELIESKATDSDQLSRVRAELDSFSNMSDTDNERINHIVGQISGISREHKERQTEFFDIQEEFLYCP